MTIVLQYSTIVLLMSTEDKIQKSLGEALFQKIKRQLLSLFFLNPDKSYYHREIIRLLKSSPGSVEKELKNLVDAEILNTEFSGNRRYYQVNQNCFIYNDLREIVIKTFGVVDILRQALEPLKDKIEIAFIYGSVAQKTDTGNSDIDVLFVSDLSFREFAVLLKPLEDVLQREINFSIYPITILQKENLEENHFMSSVVKTKIIPILGEVDVFTRLAK